MGAGKSAVGAALAERLRLPFVDMDGELVRRFGEISLQFSTEGEAVFRHRERSLVRELSDGRPRVVATGGGVWACPENRALLQRCYRTVVLTAPLHVLRDRVGTGPHRPLWDDAVADRFRDRQDAYAHADLHVDVSTRGVDEVVTTIVEAFS
jgi:shikimate kinase